MSLNFPPLKQPPIYRIFEVFLAVKFLIYVISWGWETKSQVTTKQRINNYLWLHLYNIPASLLKVYRVSKYY